MENISVCRGFYWIRAHNLQCALINHVARISGLGKCIQPSKYILIYVIGTLKQRVVWNTNVLTVAVVTVSTSPQLAVLGRSQPLGCGTA